MEDLLRVRERVSVCVTSSSPPSSASFGKLGALPARGPPAPPSAFLIASLFRLIRACVLACCRLPC